MVDKKTRDEIRQAVETIFDMWESEIKRIGKYITPYDQPLVNILTTRVSERIEPHFLLIKDIKIERKFAGGPVTKAKWDWDIKFVAGSWEQNPLVGL